MVACTTSKVLSVRWGVARGGTRALMTEELLDDAPGEPALQELRGVGVAERVDGGIFGEATLAHHALEGLLEGGRREGRLLGSGGWDGGFGGRGGVGTAGVWRACSCVDQALRSGAGGEPATPTGQVRSGVPPRRKTRRCPPPAPPLAWSRRVSRWARDVADVERVWSRSSRTRRPQVRPSWRRSPWTLATTRGSQGSWRGRHIQDQAANLRIEYQGGTGLEGIFKHTLSQRQCCWAE
jgi:hypothetical protein